MPHYLIVRDAHTKTPVELTREEAQRRAETQAVFELDADGQVLGQVGAPAPAAEEVAAVEAEPAAETGLEPVAPPAAKKPAAKAKKAPAAKKKA